MKFFKRIWDMITTPFISVAVMIDESRRINEDGSSTTLGYPTDWLIEVGYGQSSLDDIAALANP